jgi:2-octaprenyl-6-methoxyphenol hydroxylase
MSEAAASPAPHAPTGDSQTRDPVTCDVVVVGGGIAGLAATLALAQIGLEAACIDPQPPEPERADELDGRTTALLMPSIAALETLGVWTRVAAETAPLWRMRIVDDSGGPGSEPRTADFDARTLEDGPFGYNVPNPALRRALLAAIGDHPNARHLSPAKLADIVYRDDAVHAELADGRVVQADLAVGADGKESPSREAAGIRARRWDYGQTAMAFTLRHSRPHNETSTEFHRPNGPFVVVPLPGRRSSVVWVEHSRSAPGFLALDDAAFLEAAQARTRNLLGRLEAVGPRFSYPVTGLLADSYAAPRLALVGEAAHGLPPIGAQGLNLGLSDVATLADVLADAWRAGRDLGELEVLRRYERRRRPDVLARTLAIDNLNRFVKTALPPLRALRQSGLALVDRVPPLKTALMRQGMTPLGRLPALMRGELP